MSNMGFLLIYAIALAILAIVLCGLNKIISKKEHNSEKKTPYECGFEPFMILKVAIEISFILVAFIFLIFDLELIFIIGFLLVFGNIGTKGLLLLILYVLTVWFMVIVDFVAGILSWPIWNKYVYGANPID